MTDITHAATYLESRETTDWAISAMALLAIAACGCLVIGFRTTIAAVAAIAVTLFSISTAQRPLIILLIVVAVSVAILGPGAWSVDARLFGRREIIIPPMPRSQDPP